MTEKEKTKAVEINQDNVSSRIQNLANLLKKSDLK